MRIERKRIVKGEGYLTLVPTEEEDYWHIYNLVTNGDTVKAGTFRKITRESKTGVKDIIKKKITLTLKIVAINYYAGEYLQLSLKGRNIKENDYLKMGQYHTFNLELGNQLTIYKKNWDSIHYNLIKELSNPIHDTDVAAIVMDEGVAHVCYVKSSITQLLHKVEQNIPKKKSGSELHTKAMTSFFQKIFDHLVALDYSQIKCVILSSPGFVKDEFYKFITEQLQKPELSGFNKKEGLLQKIVRSKTSTGYLNSLTEVLSDPTIQVQLKDTKALKEVQILEEFYKAMSKDPDTICYGQNHITKAFNAKAIQTLLISDSLFRAKDLLQRRKFTNLVDSLQRANVRVSIFSSLHNSGEKLNKLTGIAAILKFPMALDDEEMDENEEIVENFQVKMENREDVDIEIKSEKEGGELDDKEDDFHFSDDEQDDKPVDDWINTI